MAEATLPDIASITVPYVIPALTTSVPIGEWSASAIVHYQAVRAGGTGVSVQVGLTTSTSTYTNPNAVGYTYSRASAQPFGIGSPAISNIDISTTAQTTYYAILDTQSTNVMTNTNAQNSNAAIPIHSWVKYECAYL
jgi:hypothetical protein